jgi:hypothetical protein
MNYNMLCMILAAVLALILIVAVVRKGKLWGSENYRQSVYAPCSPSSNPGQACNSVGGRCSQLGTQMVCL